jgi:hypothetical protein
VFNIDIFKTVKSFKLGNSYLSHIQRIFQQNEAPARNAIIAREYFNQTFANKWMSTYGPVQWLARSPDITPLDYFLWRHLKTVVYKNPSINLDDLKNKIIIACNELTEDQIIAATQKELLRRMKCMR